jgi:hypothetical protein
MAARSDAVPLTRYGPSVSAWLSFFGQNERPTLVVIVGRRPIAAGQPPRSSFSICVPQQQVNGRMFGIFAGSP